MILSLELRTLLAEMETMLTQELSNFEDNL